MTGARYGYDLKQADLHSFDDRLLTVAEAAQLLRMARGSVYHLVSQKRLPVVKISARCIRFSQRALLQWIECRSEKPLER
jgi:excisionase family DNA binding protein